MCIKSIFGKEIMDSNQKDKATVLNASAPVTCTIFALLMSDRGHI